MRHPDEVEENEAEHQRADEGGDGIGHGDLAEPFGQEAHRGADRLLVARDRQRGVREEEEQKAGEEEEPADHAPAGPPVRVAAKRGRR